MGPGPAGSTDAVCVVAGGSPEPRSVEPLAAVCLEETSRQRGVLALGLVVGALGKPYACAQAAMRCTQAGSLAYFARVGGSLAAGFFSASRFEIFLRKFLEFQQLVVSLANTLVNVFGLACSSFSLSCCNFISFLHFDFDQIYFPHRSSSDVRTSCASCTAGCWRTIKNELHKINKI